MAHSLQVSEEIVGPLIVFSPVFFLSGLTLYPHIFYLTFYLLSIGMALRIREDDSRVWQIGLGFALALASLSLDHWPVLCVLVTCLLWKNRRFIPLIIFAGLASAWLGWEWHVYGRGHFWANLHVRASGPYAWHGAFLPAVFIAGGLPFIAVGWAYMRRQSPTLFVALIGLGLAALSLFAGPHGGFSGLQAMLLAVELATGLAFLTSMIYFWKESTLKTDRLLIGWFFVEYLFIQKFLVYPSGHHLLMIALPAALLSIQMARSLGWKRKTQLGGMCAMGVLTFALATADQEEAFIGPRLAQDLAGISGPRFYWGNDFSGFSYYLKAAGWKAYDARVPLEPGAVLAVPRNFNVQGPPWFLADHRLRLQNVYTYSIKSPLRTFSIGESAGWYSASWGALPYAIAWAPAETFYLYSLR
jgi:hypothetical protein